MPQGYYAQLRSSRGALNNRRTFRPELIQWLGLFRNMRRFSSVCAI